NNKIALVTGGGSGIGRAICERFAEEGARVVVNDVRQEAAEATAKALGAGARAIAADVADSNAVRATVASLEREHGRLEALVPHYSAAKGAILSFTRAVAREVASRGIRVNAICPGYIDTPMTAGVSELGKKMILGRTPMGRIGEPCEIAAAALFLAGDDSSFVTGQWLSPNGGLFIG